MLNGGELEKILKHHQEDPGIGSGGGDGDGGKGDGDGGGSNGVGDADSDKGDAYGGEADGDRFNGDGNTRASAASTASTASTACGQVLLAVRIRPLKSDEKNGLEAGHVVKLVPNGVEVTEVVHRRTSPSWLPVVFKVPVVFDETKSTEEVFAELVSPLLADLASNWPVTILLCASSRLHDPCLNNLVVYPILNARPL